MRARVGAHSVMVGAEPRTAVPRTAAPAVRRGLQQTVGEGRPVPADGITPRQRDVSVHHGNVWLGLARADPGQAGVEYRQVSIPQRQT